MTKSRVASALAKDVWGAVQCINKECGKVVRPASSDRRIKVQVAGPCTFCKVHSLEHVTCSVTVNFKICGKLGHFKHKGTHTHGTSKALHDTMEVLEKVEKRVLECPSETAHALRSPPALYVPSNQLVLCDLSARHCIDMVRLNVTIGTTSPRQVNYHQRVLLWKLLPKNFMNRKTNFRDTYSLSM
ncbi:hypothetical protein BDC45DRAFT_525193 [Circinella umbellata]|nr:hypothetical protein BDC45DRAFT_525193 [Circinella umbellata]